MGAQPMTAAQLPAYDGGLESWAAHSRYLARVCRASGRCSLPGDRPTAAQLERHAKRFGPEGVAETAALYGVSIAIERPKAKRGPSGPSLKTRVKQYLAAGHSADVIAELEDLSPARARRLIEEVS